MLRIVERHQVVFSDQPVAGVGGDDVDLVRCDRRIHEVGLHLPLLAERQVVSLADGGPFGTREEFVVAGDRHPGRARGQIGDRADAELFGALPRHRQRIGVFEAEVAEQRDVSFRQFLLQRIEQRAARHHVGVMKLVRPQRAGIIDIDVDIVGGERVEDHVGAEAAALGRGEAGGLDPLRQQRRQHILLGEGLGADDIGAVRTRQRGAERRRDQCQHAGKSGDDPHMAAQAQAGLDQRQQLVDDQRQDRRRDAAEQDEHPVLGLQSGEDVVAEAGLADRSGQRRGADHPHRGGADAGHDDRHRQRQLDHGQRLAWRHADALRRLQDGGIDALQPGNGVAQHRQHRIQRQRQHRGQEAEGGEFEAEPPARDARERQQQRIEQRQQGEARNGLDDRGHAHQPAAQLRAVPREQRERQADEEAERQRDQADADVIAEIIGQARPGIVPARIGPRRHVAAPRGNSFRSRSAWVRGVCNSSRT